MPFTLYCGLINAISTSLRLLSENIPSRCPEKEEKEKTFSTKYVYNLLLKKAFVPPTAESKILKHGFTPETIQKVYELPFLIKCDIKITKMSLYRAKV